MTASLSCTTPNWLTVIVGSPALTNHHILRRIVHADETSIMNQRLLYVAVCEAYLEIFNFVYSTYIFFCHDDRHNLYTLVRVTELCAEFNVFSDPSISSLPHIFIFLFQLSIYLVLVFLYMMIAHFALTQLALSASTR